jgi:hypothetical protein
MKPTLPEDRELEEMSSVVSEHYRAAPRDEPSARLDAAVSAAARQQVNRSRHRRSWQVPASIAAMLVIGVSLVLLMRDNEPPLATLESPADEAKLAKPAASPLALKPEPKANMGAVREARPSRERSARPDREPTARKEAGTAHDNAVTGAPAPSIPAPAAPAVAAPMAQGVTAREKASEREQARDAEPGNIPADKKAEALTGAARPARTGDGALAKQKTDAAADQPKDWLGKIDGLLRDGKDSAAREQLVAFRRQYPDYPIPQRLQALLPLDQH